MISRLKQFTALLCVTSMMSLGCYNTYQVPKAEFERLQQAETSDQTVVVRSKTGDGVEVTKDTRIFVRSDGGRRYQVTPFNFKMTETQLVASDRDQLLSLGELKSYEVDHISVLATTSLIVAGAGAVGGLIFALIATSGDKKFGE